MRNALLVIDVQKIYQMEETGYTIGNISSIIRKINVLIEKACRNGDLIVYIKHEHLADGSDAGRMFDFAGNVEGVEFESGTEMVEFIDTLNVIPEAPVVVKHRYDAFVGTSLKSILDENNVDKVTICGFMTNFCCESTARHAHDMDYYVDFVVDAMGTPGTDELSSEEVTNATIATIQAGFAVVVNTEEL